MNYIKILLTLIFLVQFPIYSAFSQDKSTAFVQNRCANCHTIGKGRFVGPDLLNARNKYTKDELVKWSVNSQIIYGEKGKMPINEGYPPMPPMNIEASAAEEIANYLINFKLKKNIAKSGTIKGKVFNKTLGKNAKNIDVVLISYLGDKKIERRFGSSDESGLFSFDNLPWDKSYELTIFYRGTEYISNKMVFAPNEDTIELDLPVFETTDSDENIFLNNLHTIIYNSKLDGHANITNIYEFVNSSDTIYVGSVLDESDPDPKSKTISFSLPAKAKNVSFLNGVSSENIIEQGDRVFDTSAFHPGVRRVLVSYDFPLDKLNKNLELKSDYSINNQIVLIKKEAFQSSLEGLDSIGEVVVHDEVFYKYEGFNINPGNVTRVSFKTEFNIKKYQKYIPVFIFVLFLISAFFYLRNRNSSQHSVVKEEVSEDDLLKRIAELDELFESNKISEQQYKAERDALKAKLVDNYKSPK